MLPLIMFTGEIADAKVVLHRERRRRSKKFISLTYKNEVYTLKGNVLFPQNLNISSPELYKRFLRYTI